MFTTFESKSPLSLALIGTFGMCFLIGIGACSNASAPTQTPAASSVNEPPIITNAVFQETVVARDSSSAPIVVPTIPIASTPITSKRLRWTDPSAWPSGKVPVATDSVVIAKDTKIILDANVKVKNITILGVLEFDRADLALSANWIVVQGPSAALVIGSTTEPFSQKASITLTGLPNEDNIQGMGSRGLFAMDGAQISIHGESPNTSWSKLASHLTSGSSKLQLEQTVNWKVDDEILVTSTNHYPSFRFGDDQALTSEKLKIKANQGAGVLELTSAISSTRWGTLQAFDQGRVVVDERAEVANLSRNITISGANDGSWQNLGFGAQVMVMSNSSLQISGVEFRRSGQAGIKGRYPIHWHNLSYRADGSLIGDAAGQYLKNSTIVGSSNRCITLHGTNGVLLQGNICHDIKGHAIFLEDAVERRNRIIGNLVSGVRCHKADKALLLSESPSWLSHASGMWISHPDNEVVGNSASDADGHGIWLAFAKQPLGSNKNVKTIPYRAYFGKYEENTLHSNRLFGHFLDSGQVDDAGKVDVTVYVPFSQDGHEGDFWAEYANVRPFTLRKNKSWKHKTNIYGFGGPYWNRAVAMQIDDSHATSFEGPGFSGSAMRCTIRNSTIVGNTNNNSDPKSEYPPVGAASYHGECGIANNTFVNLPLVIGKPSGAFSTVDYYTEPVDRSLRQNTGNRMVATHPGARVPSPSFSGPGHSLAGALFDPLGIWGTKDSYWVFDKPYFTGGTQCTRETAGNGASCAGPYYGIRSFFLNQGQDPDNGPSLFLPLMHIRCTRLDQAAPGEMVEVQGAVMNSFVPNMRHCAMLKNSTVKLEFPNQKFPVSDVEFYVTELFSPADSAVLAVQYETSDNSVVLDSGIAMPQAASLADLNARLSTSFYHDKTSKLIWIKLSSDKTLTFDPLNPFASQRHFRIKKV